MRRTTRYAATLAAAALVAGGLVAQNQDAPAADEMDMDAMMQAYVEAGQPGEMHELLAKMAGEWDVECEFTAEGQTMTSQATASAEMIMKGRYVQETFSGDMMGSPFTGMSITGFDNVSKKVQSTWIDDMSTGVYFMEGNVSPDGKTLTMTGVASNPMTGGGMPYVHVITFHDDGTHTAEMYEGGDGGLNKNMTLTYTKK